MIGEDDASKPGARRCSPMWRVDAVVHWALACENESSSEGVSPRFRRHSRGHIRLRFATTQTRSSPVLMGSVFSAVPVGSRNKLPTSEVCDSINNMPATVEDGILKLSSNAQILMNLLSSLGSEWIDLDLFLAIGEELGNYGVVDEGKDTLISAIGELHRERLVEFLGESDYRRIRVTYGTKLTQEWVYPDEEAYYNVGCRMLFVGMGLIYGLTHLRVQLNASINSALEISGDAEPRMSDHVWDILRAGFSALSRTLGRYGYNRIGVELMMISMSHALALNKARENPNVAGGRGYWVTRRADVVWKRGYRETQNCR
jgi:hypothetical protein